ncbi:MAG: TorF family putative porin [Acidiferrobacterales bacterium]|nr:TorF family putative porin [Acidiferrobacterales bacterium]
MKKLTSTLIAAGVIAGASISAPVMAEGFSGNVSLTNDYSWRGIQQSGGQPVVQGGLDWEKDKLSFGVWGSGLSTNGTELDVYGAYNFGPIAVGAIYYYYPDQSGWDFYELNVGGDLGPVSLMGSYNFDSSLYYLEGAYSLPMSEKVSLDLHVGYGDGGGLGTADYDASVGVSGSAAGLDLSASYVYMPQDTTAGKFIVAVGKSM